MKSINERDYYTVAEVAEILDVSHSTVWRWIRAGKLSAYRVGSRNLRIRRRDLEGARSRMGELATRSLSLEEARQLTNVSASETKADRRKKLFDEIQRTRPAFSIAPLTSDELVRLSRDRDNWHESKR